MKKKKRMIVLAALVCFIVGCGQPSVENETNVYNHYQENLKELAEKYPAFRSFMVVISNEAYTLVRESQNIEAEDRKAQKIAEANKIFSDSALYGQLNSIAGRFESIKKKQTALGYIADPMHKAAIRDAIAKADQASIVAAAMMKNAKPANMEAAVAEIKKADSVLIEAEYKLNSVEKVAKPKTKPLFKKKKK